MNLKKQVKHWGHKFYDLHSGAAKTLKFWDPKRVKHGVSQQWKLDPLGKQLNKLMALYGGGKFNYGSSASSGSYSPRTIAQLTTHK